MTKRVTLLVAISLTLSVITMPVYRLAEWFGAYPVQYFRVGMPSYSKARSVADSFMAKATDGPWDYANESFILDFDGTLTGAPKWIFRYHNPKTGQDSIRLYVPIPEYKVYHTAIGLDSLPMHGSLP